MLTLYYDKLLSNSHRHMVILNLNGLLTLIFHRIYVLIHVAATEAGKKSNPVQVAKLKHLIGT